MAPLRRFARLAGTLIVALLLVVATVAVVVETDWFKNWLRLRLVTGLANVLDGELRIGRLGGSLWTGVTFDDLELLNRDGQVLTADHVRVRYDPFTLARRRWIVDRVDVERASIRVVETPGGWNVQHLTRPRPRGGTPPTVVIRDLNVVDSTVTIDPASAEPRTLTSVDLNSSITVSGGVVSMTVDSLRGFDSVTGLALRNFSGTASDNFRTFDVRFAADAKKMILAGNVRGEMTGETRVLTASVDSKHLDLSQLLARPPFESDITGHVTATATLPPQSGRARVAFEFSGSRSRAFGYTAERIEATGQIAGGAVTFDSRVSGYGARASVHGVWRWAERARPTSFTGHGTFASVDVRRLPPMLKLPPLESNVAGRFDTAVDGLGWRAHATFSGGVVEGAAIGEGTEASIQVYGGVTSYAVTGTANHVDLERFGRAVPVSALSASRFSSDLSGRFFVAGQNSADAPPLVVGTAELVDSTVSGTHLENLTALACLTERRLMVSANGRFDHLNELTLAFPDVPFVASGEMTGWLAIADIDQPITEDNLQVSARATLGPSIVRGVAIDSAVADGRLLDGALTLNSLEVRTADGVVRASGALGIHEPVASDGIVVAAEINNRAFLERILQQPIQTAGSVDATITGTTASPSATGTLTLHETAYRDVITALAATTKFTVDWPERDVERLSWKIQSDATFVTLGSTEIQRLVGTAIGGPREMAVEVTAEQKTRSLGIEGRLTLLTDARELLLRRLALTTENIEWSLPAGQSAVIQYGGNRVDVSDLTLVRGAQQIAIAGGFDLGTGEQPAAAGKPLELKFQDVELADVNHALLGTRQLTGRINGAVTVSGNREAPVVDGDIAIAGGTVQGVPYQSVRARGQYTDGIATIDAVLDQAPGAELHATGTVPLTAKVRAGQSMDLRVTGGPVNLGLAQAFTTELDKVAGDAALDLRVTGSISDPIVVGTATLANGAFDLLATGVRYQNVEAALDFTEGHMAVRHFRLVDGTGDELTATGGLDVRRGVTNRAVDISVRSRSFSVLANKFGTAEMNMDIRVSGDLAAPVVSGTATLEQGRIEVADLLEKTTAHPYATTPQAGLGAEQPPSDSRVQTPWERADVALKVNLPDNLVLRGRNLRVSGSGFGIGDMNIITGGSFDVTKRPGAPVDVRGTLEIVQGSYSFQGRRFEIERGSDVRFPGGGSLTDPLLNVSATREVSGVTAEVRLRGNARSPELSLSSRPALDESDILSLIVFNQPVSSLGSAQQANLGERAASMAAGAIASPLADSIGRALNLDVFEIQAPTDGGTGSVLLGSQVGSRVLVGLRQEFGHSEASMVTLEYRVNQLLRFVTSVATGTLQAHATRRNDRGGVDLIFVIRY